MITGASFGIGRELARVHAAAGGNLVVVARTEEQLLALKKELEAAYGVQVWVWTKDLTLPGAARELLLNLQEQQIYIDYLINNAGMGAVGAFQEIAWAKQEQLLRLNIFVATELCHLFIPLFLARGSGRILNVSSTASLLPGPMQASYFASKAYLSSLSYALSEELKGSPITVTTLLPGPTASEFGTRSGMDKTALFAKTFPADQVAKKGYAAMLKGKRCQLTSLTPFQKIMQLLMPLIPLSIILPMVKKRQTPKD